MPPSSVVAPMKPPGRLSAFLSALGADGACLGDGAAATTPAVARRPVGQSAANPVAQVQHPSPRMTTSGPRAVIGGLPDPKFRLPDPNTTGTTSIATSSTRPRAKACPTAPTDTATVRSPASSVAFAIAWATSSTKWYEASGCHPSGLDR
jgi:hypothetical protein